MSAANGESTAAKPPSDAAPVKKAQRDMSKAERRELQEQQKAAKAAAKATGGDAAAKPKPVAPAQKKDAPKPAASKPPAARPAPAPAETPAAGEARPPARPAVGQPARRQHLDFFEHLRPAAKNAGPPSVSGIDPEVQQLGLRYSSYRLRGGNARARGLVVCLRSVIEDYTPPGDQPFSVRALSEHVERQLDYLARCRPFPQSMKSVVAHLKEEIGRVGPDADDRTAKEALSRSLHDFAMKRISEASDVLASKVASKVADGDRIVVFGLSSCVLAGLRMAARSGKQFEVIVVDGRPLLEGRETASALAALGVSVVYVLPTGLVPVLRSASKCLFGASELASNGAVVSRSGHGFVSALASSFGVPVLVFCESYKVSDEPRLDSLAVNELGDELWSIEEAAVEGPVGAATAEPGSAGRKPIPVTPLYDATSAKHVTEVIHE
ncbi:hypothetical protein DFJ74DRAFT_675940 [Hyaloraphidium curvatum]|nr:hypothetical protein DFJ74DRAFT_675940 [Hyaloraphidium curvatum]